MKFQIGSAKVRSIIYFIVTTAIMFGAVQAFLHRQEIIDYSTSLSYAPSSEIQQILNRIQLKDYSKTIFYASNPRIQNSQEFNRNCKNEEQGSAILGCYTNKQIYVYNVDNEKLDGIKEVTAAHELLHAIWERMSNEEHDKLGILLKSQYEKVKTPEFESRMAIYAKSEPGEEINELHSILGTETVNLSSELEEYYSKYFKNRSEIALMHQRYNSNFETLKNQANSLKSEIDTLKNEIDAQNSDYMAKINLLNSDIQSFNANAQKGYYTSQAQFYADRSILSNRIKYLNEYREQIHAKISRYNAKIDEYNKIAIEQNSLYQSINSNLSTPSSI